MPIKIALAIREGWKATQNERFAEALEVRFINTGDNKILFRYAPKCEDEEIWKQIFQDLNKYDSTVKDLRSLIRLIDGKEYGVNEVAK